MKRLLTFLQTSGWVLAFAAASGQLQAADNVHFSGALVSEPCTLPDSDTDIQVDFRSVIAKTLYLNTRSEGEPFTIHLNDCDTDVMKTVSITFEGTTDPELTDLLALDPSSSATGIAIGIESAQGMLLPVNKSSPYALLSQGNNQLSFSAFVEATPSALQNKSLGEGDFQAIATFQLAYQ